MVGSIITFTNKDSLYIFLQLGQMHYILKEWFNNWGKKICVVFLTELDEKTDTTLMCVYIRSFSRHGLPVVQTANYSETPMVRKMSHWTEKPFVRQPVTSIKSLML